MTKCLNQLLNIITNEIGNNKCLGRFDGPEWRCFLGTIIQNYRSNRSIVKTALKLDVNSSTLQRLLSTLNKPRHSKSLKSADTKIMTSKEFNTFVKMEYKAINNNRLQSIYVAAGFYEDGNSINSILKRLHISKTSLIKYLKAKHNTRGLRELRSKLRIKYANTLQRNLDYDRSR